MGKKKKKLQKIHKQKKKNKKQSQQNTKDGHQITTAENRRGREEKSSTKKNWKQKTVNRNTNSNKYLKYKRIKFSNQKT